MLLLAVGQGHILKTNIIFWLNFISFTSKLYLNGTVRVWTRYVFLNLNSLVDIV